MKTHDIGTIGEFQFAAKAIANGFNVYFPANGSQQGHDLIIEKNLKFDRIQVRTVSVTENLRCARVQVNVYGCRNLPLPENSYDYLAIVCSEMNTIWMIPQSHISVERTLSKSLPKLSEWDCYKF